MPELPEVETVVRGLQAAGLEGARIRSVQVLWHRTVAGMTPTAAELLAHCKALASRYKVPDRIEFRTELPVTVTGKLMRRELKAEAAASAKAAS